MKHSIRRQLLLMTVVVVFLIFCFIGGIFIITGTIISKSQIDHDMLDVNRAVSVYIDDFLDSPSHVCDVNMAHIDAGIIDLSDAEMVARFLWNILDTHGISLFSATIGFADGSFIGMRRNDIDVVELGLSDSTTGNRLLYHSYDPVAGMGEIVLDAGPFDARTRQWYMTAIAVGGKSFSPLYKHLYTDNLAISVSTPILDEDGSTIGVFGAHLMISQLESFLVDTIGGAGLIAIVETGNGRLVANSASSPSYRIEDGAVIRYDAAEAGLGWLSQAIDALQASDAAVGIDMRYEGKSYQAHTTTIEKDGLDWTVVTILAVAPYVSDVYVALMILIPTMILLFIGFVVLMRIIIWRRSRPLFEVSQMAERISRNDYSARVVYAKDDEFGRLVKSYNQMAETIEGVVNNLNSLVEEKTTDLSRTNADLVSMASELVTQRQFFTSIFMSVADGVIAIDTNRTIVAWNRAAERIVGTRGVDAIGRKIADAFPIDYDADMDSMLMAGREISTPPMMLPAADGSVKWIELKANRIMDTRGTSYGQVIVFSDVTERYVHDSERDFLLTHDRMTGLLNRTGFMDALTHDIDADLHPIGIMMMDINGLKNINDAFGQDAGDAALVMTADAMRASAPDRAHFGRLGGDTFAISIGRSTTEEMERLKTDMMTRLREMQTDRFDVSLGIGYAMKWDQEVDVDQVLKIAENYMMKHKIIDGMSARNRSVGVILQTLTQKYNAEKIHSERVGSICASIGEVIGLHEEEIRMLKLAATYHDIGKIAIPDVILKKPGRLTADEYAIIKTHAEIGYGILKAADEFSDLAEIVLSHHERWDGSGYPRGLSRNGIPLFSRIIGVADAFEAMTSERPYRGAMSLPAAIAELRNGSGTQFDPDIVIAFLATSHVG